jgi:hypothetical protein
MVFAFHQLFEAVLKDIVNVYSRSNHSIKTFESAWMVSVYLNNERYKHTRRKSIDCFPESTLVVRNTSLQRNLLRQKLKERYHHLDS